MPYKDPELKKAKQKLYAAKHYEANSKAIKASTKIRNKTLKAQWAEFKSTLSCMECGIDHPAVLDFHHIEPEMKTGSIHKFVQAKRWKRAFEEVEQCIVLCANCHRIVHYTERYQKKAAKKAKKNGAEAP
jgi:predicted HNH restriction endonuclease